MKTVALAAIFLSACSTPVAKIEMVETKIPVAIQPITPAQVPIPPAPLGPRPGDVSAAADVLLAKWCEAVSYFLRADPLLAISAGERPVALPRYPECER